MLKVLKKALDLRLWTRESIVQNLGLIVAAAAMVIALWSAKVQRDTMQLDERPYVKVSFEDIKRHERPQNARKDEGQWSGYDVMLQIQVRGKTPAFNIAAHGKCVPEHFLKHQGTDNGLTWRLWSFLFDEAQTINCHVEQDLPDGNLPPNVPFELNVTYDDIFKNHHRTTFCQVIITMRDEGTPRSGAVGTVECEDFKFVMD